MSGAVVRSPARMALRRFRGRPAAVAGLIVIVAFVLLAALAPWVAQYDPEKTSWTAIRKAPSLVHWMGTDENGRDVFARVVFGARASLLAGTVSVLIAAGIGVPLGLLAGFAGGVADAVIGRVVDAMLACPFLILAIALAAFLGPALSNAMIAIGVSAAPIFVRVARGATMDAATNEYVEAARALGNPPWRVAVRHVLPNIVPPVLVQATLAIATAIIAEASLSFLGLGAATAGAELGQHAQFGAAFPHPSALACRVPRAGDLPRRAVLQPDRRWAARRPGPAETLA